MNERHAQLSDRKIGSMLKSRKIKKSESSKLHIVSIEASTKISRHIEDLPQQCIINVNCTIRLHPQRTINYLDVVQRSHLHKKLMC